MFGLANYYVVHMFSYVVNDILPRIKTLFLIYIPTVCIIANMHSSIWARINSCRHEKCIIESPVCMFLVAGGVEAAWWLFRGWPEADGEATGKATACIDLYKDWAHTRGCPIHGPRKAATV